MINMGPHIISIIIIKMNTWKKILFKKINFHFHLNHKLYLKWIQKIIKRKVKPVQVNTLFVCLKNVNQKIKASHLFNVGKKIYQANSRFIFNNKRSHSISFNALNNFQYVEYFTCWLCDLFLDNFSCFWFL